MMACGVRILEALLLALCGSHALAVRLRSAQGKPPAVAGTLKLSSDEMAGKLPIFVDAFPDSSGKNLYVIFNFSPLFTKLTLISNKKWKSWRDAKWSCKWSAGAGSLELDRLRADEQRFFAVSEGSILHATLDEDQEGPTAQPEEDPVTFAKEESETFRWFHHSLVMSCPMPQRRTSSQDELSVTISVTGDAVNYERSSIPVADRAFVREGQGPVLCTMLFEEKNTASILRPWVQYHAARGFDQILLYVEDRDSSWAGKAIADVPGADKVTVVPFWFGNTSQQRAFHMQGGMLHHCLYQTRGRVEWLAVADIDEYFDVLPGPSERAAGLAADEGEEWEQEEDELEEELEPERPALTNKTKKKHRRHGRYKKSPRKKKDDGKVAITDYIAKLNSSTGAVLVRSQFWAGDAYDEGYFPFPCYLTCRDSGYFPAEIRSKWLGRADNLRIINPHIVKVANNQTASVLIADPSMEIRVNHFKQCAPGVSAVDGQCSPTASCEFDSSFRDRCSEGLGWY